MTLAIKKSKAHALNHEICLTPFVIVHILTRFFRQTQNFSNKKMWFCSRGLVQQIYAADTSLADIYFFLPVPTFAFLVPLTFFCRFFNSFRCFRDFRSIFSASPWRISLWTRVNKKHHITRGRELKTVCRLTPIMPRVPNSVGFKIMRRKLWLEKLVKNGG